MLEKHSKYDPDSVDRLLRRDALKWRQTPPPDLRDNVMSGIARERNQAAHREHNRMPRGMALLAAAIVLLITGVSAISLHPGLGLQPDGMTTSARGDLSASLAANAEALAARTQKMEQWIAAASLETEMNAIISDVEIVADVVIRKAAWIRPAQK